MQKTNSRIQDIHIKKKKRFLEKSEYLNLPDLHFYKWCNTQFGLNRGVYNTIDMWLYEYGIKDILSRRIHVVAFLRFVKDTDLEVDPHKFIRFGNGGLIKKLNEFI